MKAKSAPRSDASAVAETASLAAQQTEGPGAKPVLTRILVGLDFSACSLRALEYALLLAEPHRAALVLLHVFEPPGMGSEYLPAERNEWLQSDLQAERDRLAELQRRRIARRVDSDTLVRVGRAWSEIPETARALGADLIVLGARGELSSKAPLAGGTAEGVIRHAHCPVLLVP